MDTAEFLRLIWPDGSTFFATELAKSGMKHHLVENTNQAAKQIAHLNKKSGNVYYAMASFKAAKYIDAKGKERKRTQENVDKLKCFWIDLDCKGGAADYPTQADAVKDILRLSAETNLPRPTATVNSGYGIHAYWVLDDALSEPEWMAVAKRWEATLNSHGVRHDSSCTTDSARILRPIGTHNKKSGAEPREVKLVGNVGAVISLEAFTSCLSGSPSGHVPSFDDADLSLNQMAEDAVEFRPSSIHEIVKECALLHQLHAVGGNVSEPLWHKSIGLVKHTIEGAESVHEFSNKHRDYTAAATIAKAEAWGAGPTTCDVFSRTAAQEMPQHCANCKHRGTITSPILLGYPKVMLTEKARVIAATGWEEKVVSVAALPVSMDKKFKWEYDKLWRNIPDKEKSTKDKAEFEWVVFGEQLFYPVSYYRDGSDKQQTIWVLREREGAYKELEVTGGALGAGGVALFRELGERGVTAVNGGKPHMEAYITHWGSELKKSRVGVVTYPHFGWHDKDFLLGETLYKSDGTEEKVRIGGDAAAMAKYLAPAGTNERWIELIDEAYNHKGMEQYQFILGAGFGSILMPFLGVAGGLTMSAISYVTGQGKTTAMRNAFGIYGCPDENTPVTLSRSSVTHKGIFAVAGLLHNLPVLVDEMTNIDGKELSDIVYTWSQGQPRIRLVGTGELAPVGFGWSGFLLSSSNKPMTSIIANAKPGADAELARLIEFDCASAHKLPKSQADKIFRELREHYGCSGRVFAKWVAGHQDEVKQMLHKVQTAIDTKLGLTGDKRFWSAGYAAVIVGLTIAKQLGLHQFDMQALMAWLLRHHRLMCGEIAANVSTPEECFGMMLNELSPGILVTDIEGGRGSGGKDAFIIKEPRAPYTGRAILGTGIGYLSQPAFLDWCGRKQIDPKATITAGVGQGWVLGAGETEKRYPGKGTNFAMGQVRCFVLDWAKLENSVTTMPMLAEVVKICSGGRL